MRLFPFLLFSCGGVAPRVFVVYGRMLDKPLIRVPGCRLCKPASQPIVWPFCGPSPGEAGNQAKSVIVLLNPALGHVQVTTRESTGTQTAGGVHFGIPRMPPGGHFGIWNQAGNQAGPMILGPRSKNRSDTGFNSIEIRCEMSGCSRSPANSDALRPQPSTFCRFPLKCRSCPPYSEPLPPN